MLRRCGVADRVRPGGGVSAQEGREERGEAYVLALRARLRRNRSTYDPGSAVRYYDGARGLEQHVQSAESRAYTVLVARILTN